MKKLLISIIVLIVVLSVFFIVRKRLMDKRGETRFNLIEVARGDIEVKVIATGTIQPFTRVEVKSPVSGRIDKVEVDEGVIVKPGDILAWISSEDRIALQEAARAKLEEAQKSGDSGMIEEALLASEIARNAYRPVPLTNSISGEVINRSCEPGQNVTPQTTLFVIADRLVANVSVDEADIGKINMGQEALITLDAFPNEPMPGKVKKISREGTVVSDVVVYKVMVEPLNVPPRWASGMTANVSFFVAQKRNVLTLPNAALKERDREKFVLVLKNNRPEPRKIITGLTDGKVVEVIEGLAEGEKVVVGTPTAGQPGSDSERRMRQMMRGLPPPGGFRR